MADDSINPEEIDPAAMLITLGIGQHKMFVVRDSQTEWNQARIHIEPADPVRLEGYCGKKQILPPEKVEVMELIMSRNDVISLYRALHDFLVTKNLS
jgi:hypothetical protein